MLNYTRHRTLPDTKTNLAVCLVCRQHIQIYPALLSSQYHYRQIYGHSSLSCPKKSGILEFVDSQSAHRDAYVNPSETKKPCLPDHFKN